MSNLFNDSKFKPSEVIKFNWFEESSLFFFKKNAFGLNTISLLPTQNLQRTYSSITQKFKNNVYTSSLTKTTTNTSEFKLNHTQFNTD